jgi:hypothetical protein
MGITLTPQDFVEVSKEPAAVGMQFTLCYAVMPLLAFGLGKAFKMDPAMLAGMVLVGSINGGQASNLCTYIAKGNVALSVLMTTATTLGAIFMTPLLCKALLGAVVPVDAVGIAKSTIQVCYDSYTCFTFDVLSGLRYLVFSIFCCKGCFGSYCYRYVDQQILPQLCQEDSSIRPRRWRCFHLSFGCQCRRSSCRAYHQCWMVFAGMS